MTKLLCTFSQAPKLFTAGEYYQSEVVRRCGLDFNEVKSNNGFAITLQPGDQIQFVSAFSGYKLLADFAPLDE
jgi:hypothetical protein